MHKMRFIYIYSLHLVCNWLVILFCALLFSYIYP